MGFTMRTALTLVVMLMIATATSGADVDQLIEQVWNSPNVPVIFEDDDGSLLLDLDFSQDMSVGDVVVGILDLPKLSNSNGSVPPLSIRDVGIAPPYALMGAYTGNSGLQALFCGQVASGGQDYFTIGAVTSPVIFTDPGDPNNTITIDGFSQGAIVQLWEDPTPEVTDLVDMSVAFANVNDAGSILRGELGVLSTGNFYNIYVDAAGVPVDFELNIDFLSHNFNRQIAENDLDGELYGVGNFRPGGGSEFTQLSDGDFKVMFVPEPCTMALLGLGGIVLTRRRR